MTKRILNVEKDVVEETMTREDIGMMMTIQF